MTQLNRQTLLNQVELTDFEDGANNIATISSIKKEANPVPWVGAMKHWIDDQLVSRGAILFRGFHLKDEVSLEEFAVKVSTDVGHFEEESSPRTCVKGAVYTSTDYPNRYPIQFHNEFSYSSSWPMKIFFYCKVPPDAGGETPLADSRKVLQKISQPVRDKFSRLGILYRRRYAPGIGVPWTQAFKTSDRANVMEQCSALGIVAEWDRDELITTQKGTAIAKHPTTGEEVWFNHAFFFNVASLEPIELREALMARREEELSTNTFYGDGSPIEPSVIEEIRDAFRSERRQFGWQKDDILVIDNMLCAHARNSYEGSRNIMAVMSDKFHSSSLVR
jgi:alpha-ketoglutarate-dependent taurine dioxygenase